VQQSFVVPYYRNSPIHIPRRDMVLAAADSVLLEVSVVESDDPCAQALVLTSGLGGPSMRMTVWPDSARWFRDYGLWMPTRGQVLWSEVGAPSATELGSFELLIPIGTMQNWQLRCIYAVQLDWSGNTRSETLAHGILNIRQYAITPPTIGTPALLTDDTIPVHTDDDIQVLV